MYKELTLSDGTLLKVYPVPSFAVQAAVATVPMPVAPTVQIKTMAGEEPWPDTSPDSDAYQAYLAARQIAEAERSRKQNEVCLLLGLPDVAAPEDDEWFAPLAYLGITPRTGPLGRKLDFIQYRLLATASDLKEVFDTITAMSFPSEERIEAAKQSFPDHGGRLAPVADNGTAPRAESVRG